MNTSTHSIPSLRDKVAPEEWAVRVDLAACYRLVAHYGWEDLVFTHITARVPGTEDQRSEEHTSELQSHHDLVCRLLLEKKKMKRREELTSPPTRPDLLSRAAST